VSKKNEKRKVNGSKSRRIGHSYELKIIKELNIIYNTKSLVSTRSESKRLDNLGVDIADRENILPMFVQCKNTQSTPSTSLISEAKITSKPLVIFWNKRIRKNENCVSGGEFVFLSKEFFYNLLKQNEYNKDQHSIKY
jgi:hypothetical protein